MSLRSSVESDLPRVERVRMRRQMRELRRSVSPAERNHRSREMARHLCRSLPFLRSRRVACYIASDGELDPRAVMERLWASGKRCFLPVLRRRPDRRLWFVRHRSGGSLLPNRFGIPEPVARKRQCVAPWALDLVLVPLVAVDGAGNRLGMGAGYYDRTLAYLHRREHWRKPRLIGVCHEFQRVAELEARPWDVRLDGVVTERALYQATHR